MKLLHLDDQRRLESLYESLVQKRQTYLGYPNNALLDNSNLSRFLDLAINNVGDPFVGNHGLHTCDLEREVLEFFRELLHLDADQFWGYVTNGGTEGNTFGLYLARETHPTGIVYYSEDTHYSVPKAVRLLNLRHAVIRSQPNGEIDYEHFRQTVATFRHYPVILNANIGTTMKGAIDRVDKLVAILGELGISRYYIHCDAALFGSMLPFIPDSPPFDFREPVGSIAISGHKFTGSPIPCGVVLARQGLVRGIEGAVEYIGSRDATLSGSRDGFSVLVLWQVIRRYGRDGLRELVTACLGRTEEALRKLHAIGWPAWVNPHSNILVIRRPSEALARKWHLACEKEIAHLILMPGVTGQMIDSFIEDLRVEIGPRPSGEIVFRPAVAADLSSLIDAVQATFPAPHGEPMARLLDIGPAEYLAYTELVCEKAIRDGLTFVAEDSAAKTIVGFCINEDFTSMPAYREAAISGKFQPLIAILEELDEMYARGGSIAKGEVFHLYMLGVRKGWGKRGVGAELVDASLRLARERGFTRAVAEATGAGSQAICQDLGFRAAARIEYRTFLYNGRTVFEKIEGPTACVLEEKFLR